MIEEFREMVACVKATGSARTVDNLERRLCKLYEEIGELAEAHLGVTCNTNTKNKMPADVFEESIDCLIVAIDCGLTKVEKTNVPDAILPHAMESALSKTAQTGDVQDAIFAMAEANARAIKAFKEKEYHLYYGAIISAIRCAVQIIFLDKNHRLPEEVIKIKSVFDAKMLKWQKALEIYKKAA
jgi:hypothetical protein